jgi:uncharacterized protein YqjF (DUF2071 family)
MDRIAPTRRPAGRAQGTQRWHELLFSHWQVPASVLRPMVPAGLELDAFDGRCFVGVVSFSMQNVRPLGWAPGLPGARDFGEINLRTYVHHRGEEPGVFFFSLDAASSLVVWAARSFWGLPYQRASVQTQVQGRSYAYRSLRRSPAVAFEARAEVGDALPAPAPDSLEFFLCERYQFYAQRRGRLIRARVHHPPYPLHAVHEAQVDASLLTAAGLPGDGPRTPHLFSPGVDVEVFRIERV